ncbi:MAG TPA: hypothetical protein VEY12_08465 [Thermoplasmata archaeon]|nr:hypothetical protein [Thermoplasmata archaeon]
MPVSWETAETPEPGMTRRRWVKLGLATAAFAAGAAATAGGVALLRPFLPPPAFVPPESFLDTLVYTGFPTAQWWNAKANTPVRVTDFALWSGASAVWRGAFTDTGAHVAGTGYPVLLVRVPRVDTYYELPSPLPWSLPPGFSLFYDDPARDIRIVVGLDRCTHLCCYPGWHVVTNPPPGRDYLVPPPTYNVYDQDPIYCICHGTQYDPLVLTQDTNPHNGVLFPGMKLVHTPGTFAMPLIPLRAVGDVLEGAMVDTRWYTYC